ncbi:mitotic-spindle organizing protein 2A-like isoform X1 [Anser cygnoides]|uniref:mitotic-spindle organizing protein 2A-like isoform X1 n=1 Tax=Anser cygnoides TaxID=8845 RepID=UPI0034D325AF
MSGVTLGKVAAAARPRRKVLSAEEAELFELAQAAGSGLDPEVFKVLLDLLRMNVAPLAVFQVLKSMCAGQRLPAGTESGAPAAPAPLPADGREPLEEPLAFASALRLPRPAGVRPPAACCRPLPRCVSAPPAGRAAGSAPGARPIGPPAAPGRGVRAGRQGLRLLAARPGGAAGPRGPPPPREARGARSV